MTGHVLKRLVGSCDELLPCIGVVEQVPLQLYPSQEALAALECEFMFRTRLPSSHPKVENNVVFGKVVGVYIDDSIIDDGMVQMDKYRHLARLGYMDCTIVENVFAIDRPDHDLAAYDKSGKKRSLNQD